jgi:xylan 1,4-beta-xylosidase
MLIKKHALIGVLALLTCAFAKAQTAKPAEINVDLAKEKAVMKPVWAWFGYDEPNYTYMKDGKKLLSELAALSPVPVFVRAHSLLVTGDGEASFKWGSTNAYTEDAKGNPVYSWRILDSIFDTYIQRKMKPFAQIGFTPEALSTHPEPYRHHWKPGDNYNDIYTGWAYPVNNLKKWDDLIYNWVKHCVARYGQKEVESWYWEVWNEPNGYWKGTQKEYLMMYDYATDGLKRALPTARVGGLDIAGTSSAGAQQWLNMFIKHCTVDTNYATHKIGSPLDLLSFHAKGQPRLINGVEVMNAAPQLRDIATGFRIAASYPQTKNIPLIIGESDPEGCAACGMATNPSNAYRNGTMYSSYTAATVAREYELEDQYGINFKGSVSWSFEFENQPWFYGFRDLATNGVDKPVLNVFRMYGKMGGNRVEATSNRMYTLKMMMDSSVRGPLTDIGVLASKDKNSAGVMIWNYHDVDKQGAAEQIAVTINHVPAKTVTLTHYRIDSEHSNSYEVWKKMGSPQNPTAAQITQLEKAGQLETMGKPEKLTTKADQSLTMNISLPRQGISLLRMDW